MSKRRSLGQHMLLDRGILEKILDQANLSRKDDVAFEIGTGTGTLTAELCRRAKEVISCEVDSTLARKARRTLGGFDNLTLVSGDGFKTEYDFDIFVSNLPYSKSRTAIEWLAGKDFARAVILVQKEFAEKLLAREGRTYRAVSALAQYCFVIEPVMLVSRNSFRPRPGVDSVMLKLTKKRRRKLSRDTIRSLKILFSFRGKKLSTALRKQGLDVNSEKRVEQLSPEEAVRLARVVAR